MKYCKKCDNGESCTKVVSRMDHFFHMKYLVWTFCFLLLLELVGSNEVTRSRDNLIYSNSHSNSNPDNPAWDYRRSRHNDNFPGLSSSSLSTYTFPKFCSPPIKLLVQRGDRILLPCVVEDLGEQQILWRHQTNIVAGSNITSYSEHSERIRLYQNFTLEISQVSSADEGEYICSLASPSSSLRLVHTVSVQDPPTVTVLPASGTIEINEGETVQMGCIPQGNPKPRISWTKRDGPLPRNYQKFHNESIITMEQVSRKHTGLYVCSADNGVGLPAIGAVYLRVLHTPEVEVPKRRVHGGVGYRATLICIVHADPRAEVLWHVGQKLVSLSDRVQVETRANKEYALIINSIRESDFGMYGCVANNSMGFDLRHIELSGVSNPPVVSRWETLPLSEESFYVPTRRKNKGFTKKVNKDSDKDNLDVGKGEDDTTKTTTSEEQDDYKEEETTTTTTMTTKSPIDIQVQLFWSVECYSPLIDYRLAFRPAPARPLTSRNEDRSPAWTELTIPADSSSTFLHTKSYTLRGLNRDTIYESAIKARNKFGWSTISAVCYFATFPNSSSSNAPALKEIYEELEDANDPLSTKKQYLHPYLESLRRLSGESENSTAFTASMSTNAANFHHPGREYSCIQSTIIILLITTAVTRISSMQMYV